MTKNDSDCQYDIAIKSRDQINLRPGPKVIKLIPSSTQLSTKSILLINVKMSTNVGILTVISRINTASESFKARTIFIYHHFTFYEQLKFHAQFS